MQIRSLLLLMVAVPGLAGCTARNEQTPDGHDAGRVDGGPPRAGLDASWEETHMCREVTCRPPTCCGQACGAGCCKGTVCSKDNVCIPDECSSCAPLGCDVDLTACTGKCAKPTCCLATCTTDNDCCPGTRCGDAAAGGKKCFPTACDRCGGMTPMCSTSATCETTCVAPDTCGKACTGDTECGSGSKCNTFLDGTKDCVPNAFQSECNLCDHNCSFYPSKCTVDCTDPAGPDAGGPVDAAAPIPPDASAPIDAGPVAGPDAGPGVDAGPPPPACLSCCQACKPTLGPGDPALHHLL